MIETMVQPIEDFYSFGSQCLTKHTLISIIKHYLFFVSDLCLKLLDLLGNNPALLLLGNHNLEPIEI